MFISLSEQTWKKTWLAFWLIRYSARAHEGQIITPPYRPSTHRNPSKVIFGTLQFSWGLIFPRALCERVVEERKCKNMLGSHGSWKNAKQGSILSWCEIVFWEVFFLFEHVSLAICIEKMKIVRRFTKEISMCNQMVYSWTFRLGKLLGFGQNARKIIP